MGSSSLNLGTVTETADINRLDARIDNEAVRRIISGKDIYLSPTGNDTTGDGTSALPYATLKQAFISIENYRIDPGKELNIILKSGEYTVDENFGPDKIGTYVEGSQSINNISGLTSSGRIPLNYDIHPDMDKIVIRGETKTNLPINDLNGQNITNDDGITCSYNHVVGVTSGVATPGGLSACEDDFNFSMSLDLKYNYTLSQGFDAIKTGDYMFIRGGPKSTRMKRIVNALGGLNTMQYTKFLQMSNGAISGSNQHWSYQNANEAAVVSNRGIDTPRELTRYVILGGHTVTGVTGSDSTGTGPGNVSGNHAINTTNRKYIIDDKNFTYKRDVHPSQKFCSNTNFIPNDYHCTQGPDVRKNDSLLADDTVDVARQFTRISGTQEWSALEIGQGMSSGAENVGDVYDGVTVGSDINPAVQYQNGISAGGSWGSNTRFTLDPAHGNPNIGISGGDDGEYRKDGAITATKYGAVLKVTSHTARQGVFIIDNCNPTIKDLAIVGDYTMDKQYQEIGVAGGPHGIDIINGAHPTIDDVGFLKIAHAIRVIRSSANLYRVTIDQASTAIHCHMSTIRANTCTISGCYGWASVLVTGSGQMNGFHIFMTGSKGIPYYVSGSGSILELRHSTILWNGQGVGHAPWICPTYKVGATWTAAAGEQQAMRFISDAPSSWGTTSTHGDSAIKAHRGGNVDLYNCMICWSGGNTLHAAEDAKIRVENSLVACSGQRAAYARRATIDLIGNLHFLSHGWMFFAYSQASLNVKFSINYGFNINQCYYYSGCAYWDRDSQGRFHANCTDMCNSQTSEPGIGNIAGNGRLLGAYWGSVVEVSHNYGMETRHAWDFAEQHTGKFINTNYQRRPTALYFDHAGAPSPMSTRRLYVSYDASRHVKSNDTLGYVHTVFGQSYYDTDQLKESSCVQDATDNDKYIYGNGDELST